ncbi:hypothetical protein GJ744_002235 [Endocarpon pusillum]|uniref:Uncharacterized protein n=1 Tax=Endocarpon pusillum TaxID=364733 RepID=A0A8H7E2S7_9EURO|nr:hypothetical protein GJ744_002235 [Endocarpon pusillum]
MTDGFSAVANQLSFCPTFFENDLVKGQLYPLCPGTSGEEMCRQPMVLLSSQYGSTIDWTQPVGATAISIIQELLTFEACAVLQYLNMLEVISADFMKRTQFPSYEHTKLETILHFDYMKEVLSRWKSHLLELSAFVKDSPEVWRRSKTEQSSPTQRQRHLEISNDLAYLKERADSLITTCDDGEATLMSNASVQEAKRSAREASLVTELAKATNRLTFIFLPISFITSVFGMNFSQFGQGPLSIWIWVVIACPMLIFSVIIVEKGSWIKRQVQRVRPKTAYDS